MENEKIPEIKQESQTEKYNPNSIGELLSVGTDLPTKTDKVYRSVATKEAIDDIENSGIVRNRQSAGLVEKSRWGERVFWSKGEEGKYHMVPTNNFVIEAPLFVAQERVVTKDDIDAVYTKDESGKVFDMWAQKKDEEITKNLIEKEEKESARQEKLSEVRKNLGLE